MSLEGFFEGGWTLLIDQQIFKRFSSLVLNRIKIQIYIYDFFYEYS